MLCFKSKETAPCLYEERQGGCTSLKLLSTLDVTWRLKSAQQAPFTGLKESDDLRRGSQHNFWNSSDVFCINNIKKPWFYQTTLSVFALLGHGSFYLEGSGCTLWLGSLAKWRPLRRWVSSDSCGWSPEPPRWGSQLEKPPTFMTPKRLHDSGQGCRAGMGWA